MPTKANTDNPKTKLLINEGAGQKEKKSLSLPTTSAHKAVLILLAESVSKTSKKPVKLRINKDVNGMVNAINMATPPKRGMAAL